MSVTALKNDTRRDDLNKWMRDMGAAEQAGVEALPQAGLRLVRDAADGVIEPSDAEALYMEYLKGKSRKEVHEHSSGGVSGNTSKMRSIIKLGCLPKVDGVAVLDMVVDVRADLKGRERKVLGAYKCFVEAAKAQLAMPEEQLTREVIEGICDQGKKDKSLIDKLIEDYKRMAKRAEEIPTDRMTRALDAIREEIVEQGGEVPPTTKADKKRAHILAQAKALGMSLAA